MDVSTLSCTLPDGTHLIDESTAFSYLTATTTKERGIGWFTRRAFKKGEVVVRNGRMGMLAGEEKNWKNIHFSRLNELSPKHYGYYRRWAIPINFDGIYSFPIEFQSGATNPNCYVNHHCDPSLWFDGETDALIARRDIMADDELTIDYALYNYHLDENFECKCGSKRCRSQVKKDDWQILADEYWPHYPVLYMDAVRAHLEKSRN